MNIKKKNRFKPKYKVINFELPDFKTEKEKEIFFSRLDNIKVVVKYKVENNFLILTIKSEKLNFFDFQDLTSFASRFEFKDINKLSFFKDEKTNKNFKRYCWDRSQLRKNNPATKIDDIEIIASPLCTYSYDDGSYFYDWLECITSMITYITIFDFVDIVFRESKITKEDLDNIKAIFKRYNFKNTEQLEVIKTI